MTNNQKAQDSRKAQFRDKVREQAGKLFEKDFDGLNKKEKSKCMVRAYLEYIAQHEYRDLVSLDEEDFEKCFVDGKNDSNIDYIRVNENEVLIVQAKYHGKKQGNEERPEFTDFCEVLERLHSKKYEMNKKLIEIAQEIDFENTRFFLDFITLNKAGDAIRKRADEGQKKINGLPDNFPDNVEISCLDETDLNTDYRSFKDSDSGISSLVDVKFRQLENDRPWLLYKTNEGKRSSYIGVVEGRHLRELWKAHRSKLFSENIRNPMGMSTKVNKGIRATALNETENFFYFNNGISAVATEIIADEKNNKLSCEKFSIINGAQTVLALSKNAKTLHENDEALGKACVLLRITKISPSESKEKEIRFRRNVTRYNNTQNRIIDSDFCSNDPIQHELSKMFENLRGRKKFSYINKRSDSSETENKEAMKIKMETFAKHIHAFRYGPADIFGGTTKLFDPSESGRYIHVFGDGKNVYECLNEELFETLAGTWFVCDVVIKHFKSYKEKLLEKDRESNKNIYTNALQSTFLLIFTVGAYMRTKYKASKKDLNKDLGKCGKKNDWMFVDEDNGVKSNLLTYTKKACDCLAQVYLNESPKPDFSVREWTRKEKGKTALEKIENQVFVDNTGVEQLKMLWE